MSNYPLPTARMFNNLQLFPTTERIPLPLQGSLQTKNLLGSEDGPGKFGLSNEREFGQLDWDQIYRSNLLLGLTDMAGNTFGNTDAKAVQEYNRNIDPTSYLTKNPNNSVQDLYGVREEGGELGGEEDDDWIFEDDVKAQPKIVDSVKQEAEATTGLYNADSDEDEEIIDIPRFSPAKWKTSQGFVTSNRTTAPSNGKVNLQGIDQGVMGATNELLEKFPGLKTTSGRRNWGDKDAHPVGRAIDVSGDAKVLTEAAKYYSENIVPKYGFNKALPVNHGTGPHIHVGYYEDGGTTGDPTKPQLYGNERYETSAKLAYYKEILNNKLKEKNPEAFDTYFKGLADLRRKGDTKGANVYVQQTPYNDYLSPQEVKGVLGNEYPSYIESMKALQASNLAGDLEMDQDINNLSYGRRFASTTMSPSLVIQKGKNNYTRSYTYNPATGVTFQETGDQALRPKYLSSPDVAKFKKGGKTKMKKYEMGGTYDLSDKDIQDLKDQGYDLEIL